MCGLIGYFDPIHRRAPDKTVIDHMTNILAHRGPDSCGTFIGDHVALAFRRLSIMDLACGGQPLFNEDKSVVAVCNGEIFNYKELRAHLAAKGHVFRSQSDCEVVPHMYEEYGPDLVAKLNGQFGLMIYDKKRDLVLVARDHFGICPVYYTFSDDALFCASEIKALLLAPKVRREIDLAALDQIFCLPGIPSPRTLFKRIYSVRPGTYIIVRGNEAEESEYWDLTYPHLSDAVYQHDEEYYVEGVRDRLDQSVKRRLQAHVPVGLYLSGGLDSSLIAAMAARAMSDTTLHSFSISFGDKEITEEGYQRLMARHIRSDHHERMFDSPDIARRLPTAVWHSEQPLKETYNTASHALSESVRDIGMKVVLTGEGSDELFAGYLGYKFDRFRAAAAAEDDDLERSTRERLWGSADLVYERRLCEFRKTLRWLFSSAVNDELDRTGSWQNHELVNRDKLRGRHVIHQRSYLDFKLRLGDHLVANHGDRMAMANSVEARYPFLDRDLVDFVAGIPPNLKLNGFIEKYVLKQAAKTLVPHEIVNREKFAFVAPSSQQLLALQNETIENVLDPQRVRKQGYFDPAAVETLRKNYAARDFRLNAPYEDDLLIVVITFGLCLDLFHLPDYS
jgi:asparagine synthase (glutamine-hydrolysing)